MIISLSSLKLILFSAFAWAFIGCQDPLSGGGGLPPEVIDTTTVVVPPTWEGPPIVFSRLVARGEYRCYERPVLTDNYVVQYIGLASEQDSAVIAAYPLDTTDYDSIGIRVSTEIPNYRAFRSTDEGNCVMWMNNEIKIFNPEDVDFVTITDPVTFAFASDDGKYWVTLDHKREYGNELHIGLFDPDTRSNRRLFTANLDLEGRHAIAISDVEVREVNGNELLIGQFGYYLDSQRGNPDHTFCYNLTLDSLLWINEFPVTRIGNFAHDIAVDDAKVYVKGWQRIVAYDIISGNLIWTSDKVPNGKLYGTSPLLVGGGKVYAYEDAAGLYGYDIETGEQQYYDETIIGTVFGAERYKDRYVVLSSGTSTISIFNPKTGKYDLIFGSPNRSGIGRFSFDSFSVDEDRDLITANDYEYVFVFDVSGY